MTLNLNGLLFLLQVRFTVWWREQQQMVAERTTGQRRFGLCGRRTYALLGLLGCLTIAFVLWRNTVNRAKWLKYLPREREDVPPAAVDGRLASRIEAFCGDCHGMPVAKNYPRDAWHHNVLVGYEYYARSGRNDLDPPPIHQAVAYFRSRAPEQVVFPRPKESRTKPPVTFTTQGLPLEKKIAFPPVISHLRWTDLEGDGHPVLLACDMQQGRLKAVDLRDRRLGPRVVAWLNNPCHVEPCDLDGDGAIDLLVADLGSLFVSDHDRGRVVWLRRRKGGDDYEEIVIASGLGRVADVRAADFDGDGDADLVVAVFGLHDRGKMLLLRNTAVSPDRPQFKVEVIDERPGAIHVPVHDLNRDGRPDFVALVSQEYESVDAFINRGNAQFDLQTLWAAPDQTFGSTGIELVDLDQDGDVDVLYTNGDTFDDRYVKPSHGVQWLENVGDGRFTYRRLADLPGTHRALAGDVDLDGDLDVIAVTWLNEPIRPVGLASTPMASVVCLEQTSPGTFARHTLEDGFPNHPTFELADFDGDGDLDFAVGWDLSRARHDAPHWLTVWWNEAVPQRSEE